MANLANAFVDDAAVTAGEARVPAADFDNGVNAGASCAPGIGIATDQANLQNTLPNWTLLDQHGNARNAQIGQCIGGPGISAAGTSAGQEGTLPDAVIRLWTNPVNVNGAPNPVGAPVGDGDAILIDLAVGWTSGTPV